MALLKRKKTEKKEAKQSIFSNLSIGKKLIGGFLVVSALTAVAGVTGIVNVNTMGEATDRISYEEAPLADASMEMIISLITGRDAMGEFMNASSAVARTDESALGEFEAEFNRTVEDFDGFADIILEGGEYGGVTAIATDNDELRRYVEEADRIHNELFQPAVAELIQAGKDILAQKKVVDQTMAAMEAVHEEIVADAGELEDAIKDIITAKKGRGDANLGRIMERDMPLTDMAMEIKTTIGVTRIRIEEIVQQNDAGAVHELQKEYQETIEEFDMWVNAILKGGQTAEGRIYAATDRGVLSRVREMDENHTEFQTIADSLIAAQLDMIRLANTQHDAMEKLDEASVEVEEILEKVEEAASAEMADAMASADNAETTAIITLSSVTVIAVIVGILIGLFISRSITNPVKKLMTGLEALGGGDLTAKVDVDTTDEIGVMAEAFNQSSSKLLDAMNKILGSSVEVGNASTQISSASEQLAAGAEEQQAQLSEVATTMEQMSAMILEASKNADETRQNAQHTGTTANQGREVVSKTVTGFQTVAKTVEQAALQIQELNKRSEEIGNVIQVIDDIADQTNLLALNANIEAARAGDAGRGFAVVADEVRKLAERTVSATAEISKMIESIQGDIKAAVVSMEKIQGQSKDGLELVAQSDKSLEEISGSITGVVSAVEQIATSTNEQSSGAEEISKNIEGVTTVAKESASSAQELAASAEQLNKEVQGLNELIGQFRVE